MVPFLIIPLAHSNMPFVFGACIGLGINFSPSLDSFYTKVHEN